MKILHFDAQTKWISIYGVFVSVSWTKGLLTTPTLKDDNALVGNGYFFVCFQLFFLFVF